MNYKYLIVIVITFCINPIFFNAEAKKLEVSSPIDSVGYRDRLDVEEVVIMESAGITEIPDYAFLGCNNLRKVILPKTIRKIGFQAFSECTALEEINFPDGLEDIGSNSFTYCRNLKDVKFPDSLKHIGHNAFSFCDSLTHVDLPDSIEEVESYAFSDCSSLKRAKLPANDRLLGELIFNCCPKLEIIVMPSVKMPEIDCGSYLFDPIDEEQLQRSVLYVPKSLIDDYKKSPSYNILPQILPIK